MEIIFGIDIDEVLRDWVGTFNKVYTQVYPHHKDLVKPPVKWNWFEDYDFDELGKSGFFKKYVYDISLKAATFPGVPEKFEWLKEVVHELGGKVYIISKQSSEEARKGTKIWLKESGIKADKLVLVNNFSHKWNYCNIMVDDAEDVLNSKPKDKISIKVNCIYNQDTPADFAIDKFTHISVPLILKAIEKLKKQT